VASAQTLIDRALRLIGKLPSGESPTPTESADALVTLNDMVEDFRNDGLLSFARQELTLTLANADASYTIGPSGDVNTVRPTKIERAWVVVSDISHPVTMLETRDQYSAIPDKTTTGDWPSKAFYEPTMATGTLLVWPVPNATRTMKLQAVVPVTEFAAVGTTITLPPGWQKALTANLALELAPEYQVSPSPEVVKMARESLARIKRANARPILADSGLVELLGGGRSSNILTGP
jgi:hypothetical protein